MQTPPPQTVQVEVEKEEMQPTKQPPKKKLPAKKSEEWLSTTSAHYPFIYAMANEAFTKNIQGKQPIKERALDQVSYSLDKVIQDIIRSLEWTESCRKPDDGVL